MSPDSTELINAVGGGDLGVELDLDKLQDSLDVYECVYDPEYHPALKIKFSADGATVLIFRTGKYNIAGASSIKDLWRTNDRVRDELKSVLHDRKLSKCDEFEIRNLVLLRKTPFEFDLANLATKLGPEEATYDPEQSPYLIYRPNFSEGVFMLFRTGKILSTGESNLDDGYESMETLLDELPY